MTEKIKEKKSCLNCDQPISGNYCSSCGQSTAVERITITETWHNFLSSSFSIEGPYFTTLKTLLLNPGEVFREFIGGKRKKYYKPVAFFILNTAIYMVVKSLLGYNPLDGQTSVEEMRVNSSENAKLILATGQFMAANINNILFFMVFGISLAMKTFYPKKYNYGEYLSAGFYISGFFIFVNVFSMLVSSFFKTNWLSLIIVFLLFLLIFYASFSFFQKKGVKAVFKSIGISFLSIVLYMLMAYGFSFLWVLVAK